MAQGPNWLNLPRGLPPEAHLSTPLFVETGGAIYHEAGLSIPRRAHLSRGGPIYPEAGLSIPRRGYPMAVLRRFLRGFTTRGTCFDEGRCGLNVWVWGFGFGVLGLGFRV